MRLLKPFFLVTDIGFIIYWIVTYFHIIPTSWAFKDYNNPIIIAWNWSFFPLDILISITGLTSLYLYRQQRPAWRSVALISLVLTFCSGLQAVAFWAFSYDFDITWWLFNLYLLIYPLFFIKTCMPPAQREGEYQAELNLSSR
ncbi:YvaD family protein [Paenibacillus sp. YPG26]|uniref:YvaD family protein n=1 Tax=Paenibacillus sp. YPG26 TaxID=2878915 RepID=UPI00204058FE|nr:YvaD family protein [Paenibacillus sp. YPG26]USB33658.1 YvaD family protein [Paenibacillus sp. YPG26]